MQTRNDKLVTESSVRTHREDIVLLRTQLAWLLLMANNAVDRHRHTTSKCEERMRSGLRGT